MVRNNSFASVLFTKTRGVALAVCVLGFVCGWYALVLISSPNGFAVDRRQFIGLAFAVVLGIISWAFKCYTVF